MRTAKPPLPRSDLEHVFQHTQALWDELRGDNVFITGGTGFVGTWLIESLLFANDQLDLDVTAFVLTRSPQRYRETAPHIVEHRAVRVIVGDTTAFELPKGNFPYVIHAATTRAFPPDQVHPLGAFDADVAGTRHVLEFARTHEVRRLLFTSSGAVYGRQPPENSHLPEEYAGAPSTVDEGSIYGEGKRVSEFTCAMYGRTYGFDAVVARLFAFVGPLLPLDANYAVGNFIRDALAGGPIRIAGDGTAYRSYLYAADLAIWLWTMLIRGARGRPYNVGSPAALSISDLARVVEQTVAPGIRIEIAGTPAPGTQPARYVPSVERAERELGLRPLIAVEDGVRRTFAWNRGIA